MGLRLGFREPKSGRIPIRLPRSHKSGVTREVTLARRLAKQIGQDIEQLRWLWWQTVRRCREYRKDVAALLRCWRRNPSEMTQHAADRNVVSSKSPGWTLPAGFFRMQGRARATKRALTAYKRTKRKAYKQARAFNCPDAYRQGKLPTEFYEAEVKLSDVLQKGMSRRNYTVPLKARRAAAPLKSRSTTEDALPELTRFSRRWGLRFPIPPSVKVPFEELMTSGWCWPVKIVRASQRSLTLVLYPAAGREIVLAFIDGALSHFNPKRKRKGKMAYKMVSRKRGVKHDVRIVLLSRKCVRVTIALPANVQDVKAALANEPRRSVASWRSREDYEEVFRVIDSLKPRSRGREAHTDAIKVRDSRRAFNSLVRKFGFPGRNTLN